MKAEPSERLDLRAKTLWRVSGMAQAAPVMVGGLAAALALWRGAGIPGYIAVLPVVGAIALSVLLIAVLPALLWQRWRYEIRDEEVDLQRGLISVRRTLVPMARVQHVDTRRGPLQRRFGLATVVFYTAAGPNEIPQLAHETAVGVRDRIAALAQERDEI